MSAGSPQSATMPPVRQVAAIALIFMLIGPPVGGVVFLVGRWITSAMFLQGGPVPGGRLEISAIALFSIFASAIVGIGAAPYSYFYGIVPAAVAGLVIGTLTAKYDRLSPLIVLVVGGLIGIGCAVVLGRMVKVPASYVGMVLTPGAGAPEYVVYALYVLACVTATFACWRFARSFPA